MTFELAALRIRSGHAGEFRKQSSTLSEVVQRKKGGDEERLCAATAAHMSLQAVLALHCCAAPLRRSCLARLGGIDSADAPAQ